MASSDSVGQLYLDSFGYGRVAVIKATPLNTAGNAVIALPLLSGGLTNANATVGSGSVILQKVRIQNPTGSVSSANVSITTSNDGNISNVVVANVVLTALTGAGKYQDLTIAYTANTAITGYQTSALFVNVNTASGNSNTVDIAVYGDVVSF